MTHNKKTSAFFLSLLFCFTLVAYFLSVASPLWAKCSKPLLQRVELGSGSQQASALETAQSTLAYLAYYQRLLNRANHTPHTCDQGFQLSYGLSSAYARAQENSLVWSVVHQELNLNLALESAWRSGIGVIGLKTALGGIWLLEDQERLQANRLSSEMLSNDITETSDKLILSRHAQQVFLLLRASPFVRLNMLESEWGELGLHSEINLDYRLLNQNTPSLVSPWAWGIRLGIYLNFGHLALHENESNTLGENKP